MYNIVIYAAYKNIPNIYFDVFFSILTLAHWCVCVTYDCPWYSKTRSKKLDQLGDQKSYRNQTFVDLLFLECGQLLHKS